MNCGKKVKLNPKKMSTAAIFAAVSLYILPNILGHQKWMPDSQAITMPPTIT